MVNYFALTACFSIFVALTLIGEMASLSQGYGLRSPKSTYDRRRRLTKVMLKWSLVFGEMG